MAKAVRIHSGGGPEVLSYDDVEVGKPGPGQALIEQAAVGLNFIDIYHRTGLYPLEYPAVIGMEGAGRVLEVGEGVANVAVGDRVAYGTELGGYCEQRVINADRLVQVPDSVDDKTAAAVMLQGLTVQYLLRRTYPVKKGDTILLHAAAGGIGLILTQWAKHLGATVIGTVGSEAKAKLAKEAGADHIINYREEDFVERVKDITGGEGVAVAYDSIGKDTFPGSLDCLAPLGTWASFGQASGPLPEFNLGMLAQKGSLFATRPTLMTYAAKSSDLQTMASELMDVLDKGHVKISVNQEFALKDVADAHEALTGRKTTGSTVLIP